MRTRLTKLVSFVTVFAVAIAVPSLTASAKTAPPKVSLSKVGPQNGGGEPSIATSPNGMLYVSYPASGDPNKDNTSGPTFFRSGDSGKTWTQGAYADTQSGDTSLNVDASGAVYQGNLNGLTIQPDMLQTDVYKSTDRGGHWTLGQGPIIPTNSTT